MRPPRSAVLGGQPWLTRTGVHGESDESTRAAQRTLATLPASGRARDRAACEHRRQQYNYARFLPDALDSALGQRGTNVEVIVVDDGSTDDSREVIARYADRTVVVLQENLGQKAAFNAGLAAATGDIVMFLDSDDLLEPQTAAAVTEVFAKEAGTARVVFRLAVIDSDGRRTGAYVPSAAMPLPHGDVRARTLAFPDDLAWPSTSGNAFAAWALRRVMPLPLDDDLVNADHDLHTLIPLLGPVAALREVGGSYRVHGRNAVARQTVDVEQSRSVLTRTQRSHRGARRPRPSLGVPRRQSTVGHNRRTPPRVPQVGRRRSSDSERHPMARPTRRVGRGVAPLRCSDAPASGIRGMVHRRCSPPGAGRTSARRRGLSVPPAGERSLMADSNCGVAATAVKRDVRRSAFATNPSRNAS